MNHTRDQRPEDVVEGARRYVEACRGHFDRTPYLLGRCNICGSSTAFFCANTELYRESLTCAICKATSRYRSLARGILRAVGELRSVSAEALSDLGRHASAERLTVYDTQVPFHYHTCAYPIPDVLSRCEWIDSHTSIYRPGEPCGVEIGPRMTVQNLERLTFADDSFDIVITSDVMEHVRLDDRAHREIRRVLKPGGIYLFTVPHFRHAHDTLVRVQVVDADDPSSDIYLLEKEYHGDANSEGGALSYRAYGTAVDETLDALGFTVEYSKEDSPESGIMNTELFYCRLSA